MLIHVQQSAQKKTFNERELSMIFGNLFILTGKLCIFKKPNQYCKYKVL